MTWHLYIPAFSAVAGLAIIRLLEVLVPFVSERKGRLRVAFRNLVLALLNMAVISLLFAALTASSIAWAERADFGLLRWVDAPPLAEGVAAFLLLDGWMYLWHRTSHVLPFLWRFHSVHHSDPALDVTTAVRFHTGEIALSFLLRLLIIPLTGASLWHVVIYEAVLFPVIQFHHSNINIPGWGDRILRFVIASPFMHRVHHSRYRPETNSNYSSVFSFWDRIAGTYRERNDFEGFRFGLAGYDGAKHQQLSGLLTTPFRKPPTDL